MRYKELLLGCFVTSQGDIQGLSGVLLIIALAVLTTHSHFKAFASLICACGLTDSHCSLDHRLSQSAVILVC